MPVPVPPLTNDIAKTYFGEDWEKIRPAVAEQSRQNTERPLKYKGPFIATQLNSTRLTCFALIGCTLQLGQLHCRSPATVELRR